MFHEHLEHNIPYTTASLNAKLSRWKQIRDSVFHENLWTKNIWMLNFTLADHPTHGIISAVTNCNSLTTPYTQRDGLATISTNIDSFKNH